MKKALTFLGIFITFLVIYFLQANFFNWFTIAGVKPNLFVILVLFVGLFTGKYMGAGTGLLCGLLLDLFIGKKLGISAILLATIGLLGGFLDKNFSKESKITIMLMVMGVTALFEVGSYVIQSFIYSYAVDVIGFIVKLVIEVIYNMILTILLYPLIQRIGFAIEEIFKGNRILTRYF